jgi:hypothetical protein
MWFSSGSFGLADCTIAVVIPDDAALNPARKQNERLDRPGP